jgi:hypothetical protein
VLGISKACGAALLEGGDTGPGNLSGYSSCVLQGLVLDSDELPRVSVTSMGVLGFSHLS